MLVTNLNFCCRMQLRKIHRQWKVLYNPFPLFKNSGKLKTDEKNSALVHNISYYLIIILSAKYMASQYTILWYGWPLLITGFENIPANN